MLNNFDINEDFITQNPQISILIPQIKDLPSSIIWGHFLYCHPDSKLFNESPSTRLRLIEESIPNFKFDPTLVKQISSKLLTKAQRSLMLWEEKLIERDEFISSLSYAESHELLDKLLTSSAKMWQQYEQILERLTKENTKTHGDIEESLS
ncbi:MAG: hypothetical protein ACRDBG_25785, partial [Waterburya sp.]